MIKNPLSVLFTVLILVFVSLSTKAYAVDGRQVIYLNETEKAVLMIEMRNFLRGSQEVLDNSLKGDLTLVNRTAKPLGVKMLRNLPKDMTAKMPKTFYAMLKSLHYGFAEIADVAKRPDTEPKVIMQKLANMQKLCVACHANFQLKVKN